MRRNKVIWSPVEIEYLKKHKSDKRDQLCIALAKSRSALDKQMRELGLTKGTKKKAKTNPIAIGHQSRVGKRKDLGIFVRSGWEANMMRFFKSSYGSWTFDAYEPEIFSFTDWVKPKGQALSYTPDFRVKDQKGNEYWVEVKGWCRSTDKTKLRRFKKYYPEEFKKLLAVVGSTNTKAAQFFLDLGVPKENIIEYNILKKEYSDSIPHWE